MKCFLQSAVCDTCFDLKSPIIMVILGAALILMIDMFAIQLKLPLSASLIVKYRFENKSSSVH